MRPSRFLVAIGSVAALAAPAGATAAPTASIDVKLSPARAGKPTKAAFALKVAMPDGSIPPPITRASVRIARGFVVDMKGMEFCAKGKLVASGPSGCPAGSRVGGGTAHAQALIGGTPTTETAKVTAIAAPPRNGRPVLLLYNDGRVPISVQITLESPLLPDSGRFGNRFDFAVPPIPTVPGSPNASVLDFSTTLGATNRVKEKRRTVTHHLITAPKTCPAGGWPFQGEFTFVDGSSAAAETTVKCRGASR